MAEGKEFNEGANNVEREEIFSNAVRAGKRTYFFDVKATRRNDYYLTITESKKRYNKDGRFFYEKHKIFLYKEDFEKFIEGLTGAIEFIKEAKAGEQFEIAVEETVTEPQTEETSKAFSDIEFEDLEVGVAAEESTEE